MKAVLELELIGDNLYEFRRLARRGKILREISVQRNRDLDRLAPTRLRPWVARLAPSPLAPGFTREFVSYQTKDYSRANSEGSRGVYAYYVLGDGLYEVNQRLNWKNARRYYLKVTGETLTEIGRQEVYQWLAAL